MTETYDQVITSEEQAARVKAALPAGPVDVSLLNPRWQALRFATAELAVFYANENPAQKAGEGSSPRRAGPANQLPAIVPAHSTRMSSRPFATSRRWSMSGCSSGRRAVNRASP
jgi:hypothetical protein